MGITCAEQSQRIIFNVEWTGTDIDLLKIGMQIYISAFQCSY